MGMHLEWSPLPPPHVPADIGPSTAAGPGEFERLLETLGRELDRGEALVDRATRAPTGQLGIAELIAVQAGIYRYTEAVELTTRLVDRAQNAVRTTLESGGR
jgi:hypothetical protein